MCGLAGWLTSDVAARREDQMGVLRRMNDALLRRGPDSEGFWLSADGGVGLAHRRLAIVDLSSAGHQPMGSKTGRFLIVFNGEIYNHDDIRNELNRLSPAPLDWQGHSDTETLLAAFETWGIEGCLRRLTGMFAIALWDSQERRLILARDRLGEKPLYWGWQTPEGAGAPVFLFGSELKALKKHPAFGGRISRDALALYFRHAYIRSPHSIYQGIHQLDPGTWLEVSAHERSPIIRHYWSAVDLALQGARNRYRGTPDQAVDELEVRLASAIGGQMMADVPIGAFLSGGVDSSTVVALMQKQSLRPVQTFSIGFHESRYDEAPHARAVAAHLGTQHTELYVTPQQALDVIPRLPELYCEPFADASQIPTFLLSQMTRQQVTVALSGDGADELFAGYDRYRTAQTLWRNVSMLPRSVRQKLARMIQAVPPSALNRGGAVLGHPMSGDRAHKLADLLGSANLGATYRGLVSYWPDPEQVVIGGREPDGALNMDGDGWQDLAPVERMMLLDVMSYLPGDILTKVDRAAMGVSLETRVPFLDHGLVEFAWSLPWGLKQNQACSKWPLKQILYRHVPRELIERPKMGFAVPIDQWLRGPLRDWAESLLSEDRLRAQGFLNPSVVRRHWTEHQSGLRNWSYRLWTVLMFQAWLEHQD